MSNGLKAFSEYIRTIEKRLATGVAGEGTYYSALETLLEALKPEVKANLLPHRVEGLQPDYVVTKDSLIVGHVEAKDVDKDLDEVKRSDQMSRYLGKLPNLVLTNYLEFRWYVAGSLRRRECLGTLTKDRKVKRDKRGINEVTELLDDFLSQAAKAVDTPKELAQHMARLAHRIRELVVAAFERGVVPTSVRDLHKAFCDTLVPGLTVKDFADMYAQTIAYGLFAARCNSPDASTFTRQYARDLIPKTNPFLRTVFDHIAGAQLPDPVASEVDELAQLLARADMTAILENFGKRTAKEDPVVYFYEDFFATYNPEMRKMRGEYYTPVPVVSYIVRSIDHLLKDCFKCPNGLADSSTVKRKGEDGQVREFPRVLILDPAVGTATFLYAVVNEIHDAFIRHRQRGMWNDYVEQHLLPRLFGFELMMAPYTIAHLKLELLLKETGYRFESDQRLGIYLTNTLQQTIKKSEALFTDWITEEANAAGEIKREKPIMVVLGNPPYAGISANASTRQVTDPKTGRKQRELTWIGKLIEDYKLVDGKPLGERKQWLQDDYVKFIRFGQWRIERTGQGVLAFITNHAYLNNPTFRGMRQSLMNTFTDIYILDLHGSTKKRQMVPGGGKDENVFDIQQGVAIGLFVKESGKNGPARVHHADLWGLCVGKYRALFETDIATTDWAELQPASPFYLFVPWHEELLAEYERGWKVVDIFSIYSSGITSARDRFVIRTDLSELRQRIEQFRSRQSDNDIRYAYNLNDTRGWQLPNARQRLRNDDNWKDRFTTILYRPFDIRHIFYSDYMVDWPREDIMCHLLLPNVALLSSRPQSPLDFTYVFCAKQLTDQCSASNKSSGGGNCYTFPLYLYPSKQETTSGLYQLEERRPNLNPEFVKDISEKLSLQFVEDGRGDLQKTFGPEDVFHYAYAVFHSPAYRSRYAEFLKIDFPRLPLTSNKQLFAALAEKGAELVSLHLLEAPSLENLRSQIKYDVPGSNVVEKVVYNEPARRAYINKDQFFEGIEPEVWDFQIGGYQVCQKWLKDRKDRTLTYNERVHYQKMVVAIKQTTCLMKKIDGLIPGWPLE